MTLNTAKLNGRWVEDYNVSCINLDKWLSAPATKYGSVQLLGRLGTEVSLDGVQHAPMPLMLGVQTNNTDFVVSRTELGAFYSALQGLLEIELLDAPGKVRYGYFEMGDGSAFGVPLLSPQLQCIGTITCYNPYWYDRTPTSFGAAAATRVLVPAGTAPTRMRLYICGAYTNPTLTLRDRAGNILAQLTFTVTAADNTYYLDLVFDGQQRADQFVNQVRASVSNASTFLGQTQSLGQFVADPLKGCTIETSAGSLSGLAWRAYLV